MQQKYYSRSILIGCFAVLTFAICGASAQAADTTWTNNGVDNWFTDGNWNNNHPDCTKTAHINNGGTAQINTSGGRAQIVIIGENAGDSGTLSIDGTNGGSLNVSDCNGGVGGDPHGLGPLPGDVYVGYHDRGTVIIKNGGTLTSGLGSIATFSGSVLNSNGAVSVNGLGSSWTVNTWWLEVGENLLDPNPDVQGGNGLLSVTNGGTVTVNTNEFYSVKVGPSSTLTGNGIIRATSGDRRVVVRGTLQPTTGKFTIDANLILNSTSTLVCNVTQAAGADNVDVSSGTATITGNGSHLLVNMDGVFTHSSTQFTLLHAQAGLNGTFTNVTINYKPQGFTPTITYDANHVYLNLIWNL